MYVEEMETVVRWLVKVRGKVIGKVGGVAYVVWLKVEWEMNYTVETKSPAALLYSGPGTLPALGRRAWQPAGNPGSRPGRLPGISAGCPGSAAVPWRAQGWLLGE